MCAILSDYRLLEPFTMQAKFNSGGDPLHHAASVAPTSAQRLQRLGLQLFVVCEGGDRGLLLLLEVGDIGKDEVDARQVRPGKGNAEIDDDP